MSIPEQLVLSYLIEDIGWKEFWSAKWKGEIVAVKKFPLHGITARKRQQIMEDISIHLVKY